MKKKLLIVIATLSFIFLTGTIIFAAIVTKTSTRGNLEVTSKDFSITTEYTKANASDSWVYNEAGQKKELLVNLTNSSESDLHIYYEFNVNGEIDASLLSAILVYYNNEYIDTLSSLTNNLNRLYVNSPYAFASNGKTTTDTFTFELHQSASNSVFNNKQISINLTTYSETIDYTKYQIVKNENDFYKIIDDINTGLLDVSPTIVLANTITLSNKVTILNPTIIHTNGYILTGEITVNDDNSSNPDALLTVLGNGKISSVTVGANYDKNGARELMASYIQKMLKNGIKAGSTPEAINIIGPYTFYPNITISTSGSASYSNYVLTASSKLEYSSSEAITLTDSLASSVIKYKHIGFKSDYEDIFIHLPNDKIITNDLFLPTYVPKCNASIEWKSSNPNVFSTDGRILDDNYNNKPITLTAIIRINDKVYVRSFSFNVTSNNNMVNFQKLVKDISPLIITQKYSESNKDGTSYYLPIVNYVDGNLGNYDYRTSYKCPKPDENATFIWTAHENIGLSELKYEKYYDKDASNNNVDTYHYIDVSDNKVTLTKDTLSNYAKIKIIGTFDNGEVCESIINISISLGSDTELLEKAFNHINNCLDDISILGNIISSRINSGMINEKGDFTLPALYGEDYTIDYDIVDSSNILTIIKDGDVFNFSVDPTKFYSVETSIPVKATVTYSKTDGDITKTKIIYITVPAAVHVKDLGNISIFNSLKYQVINSLPDAEKDDIGYVNSDSLLTYSGYDYILLRDIVGDVEYLNNYAFDSLYLTNNNYKSDGSDGANGVTTITLVNSPTNNTSTTDTLAYDFIMLIQWAIGDNIKPVKDVISENGLAKISSYENISSNGETYLTENELAVIEAFYKNCTNDTDGSKWNAIKAQVLETAPGRIYDNPTLLVTILNCLTTEKGINSGWYENGTDGAYGKIYAKYLEIVNRYAITTSSNEEPMSPAQEVYNSKYYYSFTASAANNTTSGNADISIPCKYYDKDGNLVPGYCNRYGLPTTGDFRYIRSGSNIRQGVYAAEKTTGWTGVDIYANKEGNPYDSDRTKYITSAELMVLKAFWLGALAGAKDANTNSSNGVLHTFSSDSITKITNALAADTNKILPYPDYTIADFQCYGQAILNAFDACLTIPTTFTSNGIGLLINNFYDNYNGTGYKIREYNNTTDTNSFTSILIDGVPAVTNLDNLEGALSYFSKLSKINIIGNTSLAIYLSDYGLSTTFARICLTNKEITTLNMQYVSSNWNNFDITNIKHLDKLKSINISNNLGIKSVYPLLNINRNNYDSVNFFNIGEVYEYNEFVIDNLPAQLVYSDKDGSRKERAENSSIISSPLVYLSDIEDLVSEHLYLTNVIYDENGNEQNVCWRIEEGNEINGEEINQGGELDIIDDVNSMNMRVSPYFYCDHNFTFDGYDFLVNHVYKITYNNGVATVVDVNDSMYLVDIANSESDLAKRVLDLNGNVLNENLGEEVNIQNNDEFDRISEPYKSTSQTVYVQTFTSESNVTYTIAMHYQVFSFQAAREFEEDGATRDNTTYTYYLMANGTELKANNIETADASCYMVILTEKQAQFIDFLNKNSNEVSDNDMDSYGVVPNEETKVLTLGIQNLSSNVNSCYIYNVKEKKFMYSGGFDTKLGDEFKITISGTNYRIFNITANKYLDGFKQLIYDADKGSNVISAVFNTSSVQTNTLTETSNQHKKRYNSNWTLATNNQEATNIIGDSSYSYTASFNTPSISITTKEGRIYTASFNCYTIRNARQTNTYTNDITGTIGSYGHLYDNGATLLLSTSFSQPTDYSYYFCLMTNEDIENLNSWYQNPNKDASFGRSVSREYQSNYEYYIYNPFTRRYATGKFSDNVGIAFYTTSVKPEYPFALGYRYASDNNGGYGYFISQIGQGANVYTIANDITGDNFETYKSQLYYIPEGSTSETQAKNYDPSFLYYRKSTTSARGFYLKSWNAYGGISDKCYGIATWGYDSGSLWVFDEVQVDYPYTYSVQEKSEVTKQIAYGLSYTINKVSAMVVNNKISKYYEFDKFYYLDKDVTIDGNIYKKGNLIRFEYNAYKGIAYQANIVYYEVIFEYTKADGSKGIIIDPSELEFIYYDSLDSSVVGSIEYSYCTDAAFTSYKQGFKIIIGDNEISETYDEIHWIYTEESFNEVKYKLYVDEYGLTNATNFEITENYYEPTYKEATVFKDAFDARKNVSLFSDDEGNNIDGEYNSATDYYEIGRVAVRGSDLYSTQNVGTEADPIDSIFNVFDYYKFGIYSDAAGTKVPLNATYNPSTTYYFKHGDTYTTDLPTMYHVGLAQDVELILNSVTFEYFKNTLWYTQENISYEVSEDSIYDADIQYYKEAYVLSNFRQEILDAYNSVLFINNEGVSVGTDATFNPARTYWTYEFIAISDISEADFNAYKSVLYIDTNGTPLPEDASYEVSKTYYKKNLIESIPGPKNTEEEETWHDEVNVTRFYSHVKNLTSIVNPEETVENQITELDRYKSDVLDLDTSTLSKLHQYSGSESESENVYSNPELFREYELVLPGLISESNWNNYKDVIYYKSGSNYISCSDKSWSDNYRNITFYRYALKSNENITAFNVSYEYLGGYRFDKSNTNIFGINNVDVLIWDYVAPGVYNTGKTMDEILEEANSHFYDENYNLYYGKYYGYNGFNMSTQLDTSEDRIKDSTGAITNIYKKGYIYRLVENANRTGFIWEEICIYSRKSGAQMVADASTGEAQVGDIIFATSACFNSFYTAGQFYRIVEDDFTKTLNVIQFTDVTISNSTNYSDIQNQKIHYIYQSDYLGYAGTYEIVISAMVRVPKGDGTYTYTDYVKQYKIKFVGTVIQ